MKHLLFALAFALFCSQAQAVNNRNFQIDPIVVVAGKVPPVGWRVYCGATTDTTLFVLVKDVALPTLVSGIVPLADTVRWCAGKAYAAGGLEAPFGTLVSAIPPDSINIRITTTEDFKADPVTGELILFDRKVVLTYIGQ